MINGKKFAVLKVGGKPYGLLELITFLKEEELNNYKALVDNNKQQVKEILDQNKITRLNIAFNLALNRFIVLFLLGKIEMTDYDFDNAMETSKLGLKGVEDMPQSFIDIYKTIKEETTL